MKTITTTIISVAIIFFCTLTASATTHPEKDTVIIKVGNAQVIIQAPTRADLKSLSDYDINRMLMDLNEQLDETGADEEITIESDGTQYGNPTIEPLPNIPSIAEIEEKTTFEEGKAEKNVFVNVTNATGKSTVYSNDKWRSFSLNVELGTNNWLQDGKFPNESNELYSVRPWGSWFVAISNNYTTPIVGPLQIQWGGSVSWYNWKFQDHDVRVFKGENEVEFYREGVSSTPGMVGVTPDAIKSKLTASYINLHIVPMLDFGNSRKTVTRADGSTKKVTVTDDSGFRIGAGVYAGYRMGSKHKYVYQEGGNKVKDKDFSDFYLSNLRYGIRGQIGYRGTDFFVNYDLNDVFADNRGPKMNAISFGVIF